MCENLEHFICEGNCSCINSKRLQVCILSEYDLSSIGAIDSIKHSTQLYMLALYKCENVVLICDCLPFLEALEKFSLKEADLITNALKFPKSLKQVALRNISMSGEAWERTMNSFGMHLEKVTLENLEFNDHVPRLPNKVLTLCVENMTTGNWAKTLTCLPEHLKEFELFHCSVENTAFDLPGTVECFKK